MEVTMSIEEPLKEENSKDTNEYSSCQPLNHMRYRLIKTLVMFLCWIGLGLYSEVLGPSLPALRALTDTNNEEIGRSLAGRAIGMFIGSLLGAILSDLWENRRNLFMCIFLGSAGLLTSLAPICTSLNMLTFVLFLHGMCHGGLTTSGNPSLNELWNERSTAPFSFMHSGYGVGGALAPLLLQTFYSHTTNTTTRKSNSTITKQEATYLTYPYFIIGAYCLLIAFIFFVYSFLKNPINSKDTPLKCPCFRSSVAHISTTIDNDKDEDKDTALPDMTISEKLWKFWEKLRSQLKLEYGSSKKVIFVIIAFVGFFGIVGNERIFGKYQFSFAIESELKLSHSYGYLVNGLYWTCFTLGRIFVAIISIKVSPKLLLLVEIIGACVFSIVLSFCQTDIVVFFVCSAFFGLFKSPLFPTLLGVLSLFGKISGSITMIVNFGSSAGASLCQYLMGYLINKYGYYTFPYAVATTSFILLLVFVGLLLLAKFHLRESNSNQEDNNDRNIRSEFKRTF